MTNAQHEGWKAIASNVYEPAAQLEARQHAPTCPYPTDKAQAACTCPAPAAEGLVTSPLGVEKSTEGRKISPIQWALHARQHVDAEDFIMEYVAVVQKREVRSSSPGGGDDSDGGGKVASGVGLCGD